MAMSNDNPYGQPPNDEGQPSSYPQQGGSQQGGYGEAPNQGNYGQAPQQGGYSNQGSYGGPSAPAPPSGNVDVAQETAGFFKALFDFSFTHFVTPIIVKVVYVLITVALVLGWLVFTLISFTQSAGGGLLVLILGAIVVIVYLALARMTLEFYLAIVRMSEDIHKRLR